MKANSCINCAHGDVYVGVEPCYGCSRNEGDFTSWEPRVVAPEKGSNLPGKTFKPSDIQVSFRGFEPVQPSKPPIRLSITIDRPPLSVVFHEEEHVCFFVYHGLFSVTSPYVTIKNLDTNEVLHAPPKTVSEAARTSKLFDLFRRGETGDE